MNRHRILVVDPSPPVRKLLSMVFDSSACELRFASDGEEALGAAIVDPPELVLTELWLDRLDGISLCEQLKHHPQTRSAKVLVLTTSVSDWDARRARRVGADGYVTKPFSPMALLRQVDALLGNGQQSLQAAPDRANEQTNCG